jgi:hypothetical protein
MVFGANGLMLNSMTAILARSAAPGHVPMLAGFDEDIIAARSHRRRSGGESNMGLLRILEQRALPR